jgi:hypothetical protein
MIPVSDRIQKQSVISIHKTNGTLPIVQFSMTNHSADPNQKISRADPKTNSCYGTDPEKRSKQMQKSKEYFFLSQ